MRVAVCQMHSGEDVEANVKEAEALIVEAADGAADLAVLPEMFPFMGPARLRTQVAERVPGPITDRLARLARDR